MDNLVAHRPERIRELIESRGCELLYLLPYSPDLNPIEEAFAKVKHIVRKLGARTRESLVEASSWALGSVSATDIAGCFAYCAIVPWCNYFERCCWHCTALLTGPQFGAKASLAPSSFVYLLHRPNLQRLGSTRWPAEQKALARKRPMAPIAPEWSRDVASFTTPPLSQRTTSTTA
jgi:DDE superfamily endonuclease